MDDDMDGHLSFTELRKVFRDYKVQISDQDLQVILSNLGTDQDLIPIDQLVIKLLGSMKSSRIELIIECFDKMDTDNDGVIKVNFAV